METRKTNSFGVQALEEVSQECFLLHLLVDSSIKTLIKIPAFLSLSHPWLSAAFCFLRKVPGYRSAGNGNSPGILENWEIQENWGCHQNLLVWVLCAATGEREEGRQHPSKVGWERPRGTGVPQKREFSAAQHLQPFPELLFEQCLEWGSL